MPRLVISCAVLLAMMPVLAAQQPRTATPVQGAPAQNTTVTPTVTLTGCLYREAQIPGRTPNAAERAGILEDYILADARSPQGTPATGKMYKVERISDDRLKALVGKSVEVVGRIDPEGGDLRAAGTSGGAAPDKGIGPDKVSLPEFEATSIREVEGKCAATPAGGVNP